MAAGWADVGGLLDLTVRMHLLFQLLRKAAASS